MTKNNNINKKILYIEDDEMVSSEFIRLLQNLELIVVHYICSEDAYIDFQTNNYDLIIVDIELPEESGLEFISKIRLINRYISIMILSAYDHKKYLTQAIDYQVTKYITKPIDTNIFLPQLNSLLGMDNEKLNLLDNMFYYPNEYKLSYKNQDNHLTASEHYILNCLYNNRGHLVTYNQLLSLLDIISVEILRTHIKNIRKKSSKELIQTIPTLGYKLNNIYLNI